MPTLLQKRAVENLVANGGRVRKAMRDAKYSLATAKTPKKLTESKGYKELCVQYGLTDKLLLKSLVEDIKTKPKNRKAELELGFRIKGRLEPESGDTINNLIIFTNEQLASIARRIQDGALSSKE